MSLTAVNALTPYYFGQPDLDYYRNRSRTVYIFVSVSGVMELRGLLLAQKEEKIELRSLVDQMRVDIQSIR